MSRIVKAGLTQVHAPDCSGKSLEQVKQEMIDLHLPVIEQAARQGVQVLCLQELFYGPYFCAEQDPKWYGLTEHIPDGPTTELMQDLAKQYGSVLIVPMYEGEGAGRD